MPEPTGFLPAAARPRTVPYLVVILARHHVGEGDLGLEHLPAVHELHQQVAHRPELHPLGRLDVRQDQPREYLCRRAARAVSTQGQAQQGRRGQGTPAHQALGAHRDRPSSLVPNTCSHVHRRPQNTPGSQGSPGDDRGLPEAWASSPGWGSTSLGSVTHQPRPLPPTSFVPSVAPIRHPSVCHLFSLLILHFSKGGSFLYRSQTLRGSAKGWGHPGRSPSSVPALYPHVPG